VRHVRRDRPSLRNANFANSPSYRSLNVARSALHHPGQAKREPGTQKSWRTIPDKASPSPDDGGGDPPAAGKPRALSEGG